MLLQHQTEKEKFHNVEPSLNINCTQWLQWGTVGNIVIVALNHYSLHGLSCCYVVVLQWRCAVPTRCHAARTKQTAEYGSMTGHKTSGNGWLHGQYEQ